MQFQCPKCSGVVRMDDANIGKTVSCGHCNEVVNAPSSRFAAGVIINDFMIEKEVGVGGMGIVYLAKQITLDRPVALKILKEKYASDTEFVVQFVKEARAAAKLNHHSIVQAYAVGEEDGIFFFAMEYVDGKTMKEILAEEKKIEYLKAAKIVRDIADALDYAWTESKIVHHDIKPDNIMLTKNNKAKLADLGLAGIFGETTDSEENDEVLGTPQYISPEQLLGETTDVRSDIYSLGATLYHLVTGTFPYNGSSATEIAHQHVNGTFEPPNTRDRALPPALNDIICKMMSRDLTSRYQSAAEVVEDLQKFLIDNGSVSTNTTASVPIPAPTSKFPSGGLKLSLNKDGAKSAAKTVPAAPAAPAAPSMAAKPVSSPVSKSAITLSAPKTPAAPKLAVPTLNKPAAPQVAVPTLNKPSVPQVAVPALNNNTAPAVAAPKLGLKKNDAPALKKAEPETPKTEENTPAASENPVKAEPEKEAKTSGKEKKSADKKSKKSAKTGEKKKIPAGLVVLIVIILCAGGGVAFYMYKNNWKAPIVDEFIAWNKNRKEAAKRIVHRIPVKTRKEPTIQELRKDYTIEAENLKKFIEENPSKGRDFMTKVDEFNRKWGTPELENEHKPYKELIALYNAEDEKVWCAPNRQPLKAAHQAEINRRIQQEKAKIAEEKRIQAERQAEEARRKAYQKAEAERIRKEAEEKRRAEQKIREYRQKITPYYPKLAKLFYEAIFSEEKSAEFKRSVDNLFVDYQPDGGDQMAIYEQAKTYSLKMQSILSHAQKAYNFILNNNSRFCSHVLVLPRLGQVEITGVDFPGHKVTVRSVLSGKTTVLSLDDAKMRDRFFKLFNRKIEDGDGISYLPFYYEIFFGNVSNAKKLEAPSADWNEFFKYYR